MWKRIAGIALVTVSLSACAGVMATEGTEHAARSSDALTMSELQGTGVTDAFEAVQRFRPMYLNRLRDMASVSGNQSLVTVYLNDTRLGGIDMLRTVPVNAVRSIQYLSAAEATHRWGPRQPGAVIFISSRP